MNQSGIVYRQIFVSGKVQGVFFRESTRQVASELGLRGGVRNLSDGRVEVQVAGNAMTVQSLINWLKTGPKLAKVSNIEVINLDAVAQDVEIFFLQNNNYFSVWATK